MDDVTQNSTQQPLLPPVQETILPETKPMNYIVGISILVFLIVCTSLVLLYKNSGQNTPRELKEVKTTMPPTEAIVQPEQLKDWKVFTDQAGTFEFMYPADYVLDVSRPIGPILNHNIMWSIAPNIACDGENGGCPFIEQSRETVELTGYVTVKTTGTLATVGGNIPQSYISYYIKNPAQESYFHISLYEIPRDDTSPDFDSKYTFDRTPGQISKEEEMILDKIVQTFHFTSSSR